MLFDILLTFFQFFYFYFLYDIFNLPLNQSQLKKEKRKEIDSELTMPY
jgi:phosphotransferase system  glucose/maltose/N-acetylglucosamine-specific IIC component